MFSVYFVRLEVAPFSLEEYVVTLCLIAGATQHWGPCLMSRATQWWGPCLKAGDSHRWGTCLRAAASH